MLGQYVGLVRKVSEEEVEADVSVSSGVARAPQTPRPRGGPRG